jgi:hypothetical protein
MPDKIGLDYVKYNPLAQSNLTFATSLTPKSPNYSLKEELHISLYYICIYVGSHKPTVIGKSGKRKKRKKKKRTTTETNQDAQASQSINLL